MIDLSIPPFSVRNQTNLVYTQEFQCSGIGWIKFYSFNDKWIELTVTNPDTSVPYQVLFVHVCISCTYETTSQSISPFIEKCNIYNMHLLCYCWEKFVSLSLVFSLSLSRQNINLLIYYRVNEFFYILHIICWEHFVFCLYY